MSTPSAAGDDADDAGEVDEYFDDENVPPPRSIKKSKQTNWTRAEYLAAYVAEKIASSAQGESRAIAREEGAENRWQGAVKVVVDSKAWDKDIDGSFEDSIAQRKGRVGTIYQNGHKVQQLVTRLHHYFARAYGSVTKGTYNVPTGGTPQDTWDAAKTKLGTKWATSIVPSVSAAAQETAWFVFELLCPDSPYKTEDAVLKDYVNAHWHLNPAERGDDNTVPSLADQKAAKKRALGIGKDLLTQMPLPAVGGSSSDEVGARDARDAALMQLISNLSDSVSKQAAAMEKFLIGDVPQPAPGVHLEDEEAELLRRLELIRSRKRQGADLCKTRQGIEVQLAGVGQPTDVGDLETDVACGDVHEDIHQDEHEQEQEQEQNNAHDDDNTQKASPHATRRSSRVRKPSRR